MSEWFHVGQEVVCVSDDFGASVWAQGMYSVPTRLPMINEVLTVASIEGSDPNAIVGDLDRIYLVFHEIDYVQSDGPLVAQCSWDSTRFRPLRKRMTSIEIFRAMLNPAKQGELA